MHQLTRGLAVLLTFAVPSAAHADDEIEIGLAAEGGVVWTQWASEDSVLGLPDSAEYSRSRTWGPSAGLELALAWRAAGILQLGAVFRGGMVGAPADVGRESEALGTISIGPSIGLSPAFGEDGPYALLWGGLGLLLPHAWPGGAVGLRGGYRWGVSEDLMLGLGASFTSRWTASSEEGDHGFYQDTNGDVVMALELRLVISP